VLPAFVALVSVAVAGAALVAGARRAEGTATIVGRIGPGRWRAAAEQLDGLTDPLRGAVAEHLDRYH
jgi:hypothetical protein